VDLVDDIRGAFSNVGKGDIGGKRSVVPRRHRERASAALSASNGSEADGCARRLKAEKMFKGLSRLSRTGTQDRYGSQYIDAPAASILVINSGASILVINPFPFPLGSRQVGCAESADYWGVRRGTADIFTASPFGMMAFRGSFLSHLLSHFSDLSTAGYGAYNIPRVLDHGPAGDFGDGESHSCTTLNSVL
jgi:hypothetical protein